MPARPPKNVDELVDRVARLETLCELAHAHGRHDLADHALEELSTLYPWVESGADLYASSTIAFPHPCSR